MKSPYILPELHLPGWRPTKETLHRYIQIIGKIRMQLSPFQNHWWHVPLYVTSRGLGTRLIPFNENPVEINFDFGDHRLTVTSADISDRSFALYDGLSVAEFYDALSSILEEMGIPVSILAKPYEISPATPFAEDGEHHHYDKEYVERFHQILLWTERQFRDFNQNFYGKVCPIQLYWHSFDLVTTRFSGDAAPAMSGAGRVDREAYSHEVISFGFWPGDDNIPDAAFYSYTFPAPEGLTLSTLQPRTARWTDLRGSPMALMMYADVQKSDHPEETVRSFLESAYRAGTQKAGWDIEKLRKPVSAVAPSNML